MLDPAGRLDRPADVGIENGRIAEIAPGLSAAGADRVIDAGGCLVTPGLIDPHVHLREPGQEHKETIATGAAAGAAGGFTSLCCMPNTTPALDSPELMSFVLHRSEEAGGSRVFPVGAVTRGRRGEQLAEIRLMAAAGAVGFSDDGDCVASPGLMLRALHAVRDAGSVLMQHCQEETLTGGQRGTVAPMHAGAVSVRLGLAGWPRVAEELVVERDLYLNRGVSCRYHVQHVSSGGTVEILRRARAAGQPVTAEVSPHHLHLTHEACDGYDTRAKVNPPLREPADVEALRRAVAEGVITVLATDHAPHTEDEKALPFEDAPFGMVGLETALPLYAEALVATGLIDWARLIELMTIEPARLCGLDRMGLGTLAVGGPADVTVIDPDEEWTVDAAAFVSRSVNTPFDGRRMKGRVRATIVGGRVVFAREAVTA